MFKVLIKTVIVVALVILGIGYYLQPNDFVGCGVKPDAAGTGHCQSADAIVAVSGGDTTARAEQAIQLYKNGWANKLILSGAAKDKTGPSNADTMKALAISEGVNASDILIDGDSNTTTENAINSQKIFVSNDIKTVILVTSGYHQRRASLAFEKNTTAKIFNYPLSSDDDWSAYTWWLTPRGWWLALGEIVKIGITLLAGANA